MTHITRIIAILMLSAFALSSCAAFKKQIKSPHVATILNEACQLACASQTRMDQRLCISLCDMTDAITTIVKKDWNVIVEEK